MADVAVTTDPAVPAADAVPKDGQVTPPATSAATDTKVDPATKPTTDAKPDAKTKPADGPPEQYTVTLPEGFKDLDKGLLERFTPIGKELGLTQAAADKLVGIYAEGLKQAQATQDQAWEATKTKWADEVKADPELGGAKLQESVDISQKALKQFGGPKLVAFIEAWGLGNQPDFLRMMVKVGRALGEDGFVKPASGAGGAVKQTDGQVFYGKKES